MLLAQGDRQAIRRHVHTVAGNDEIPLHALLPLQDVALVDVVYRERLDGASLLNCRQRFPYLVCVQIHVANDQTCQAAAAQR